MKSVSLHYLRVLLAIVLFLVLLQVLAALVHQSIAESSQCPHQPLAHNMSAQPLADAAPPIAASLFHRLRDQILPQNSRRNTTNLPVSCKNATAIDTAALAEVIWLDYSNRLREQQRRNGGKRPRVILYRCNANMFCAGYGDRLRGMAFAFVAALLSDSAFAIEHTTPIDMATVFADLTYRHGALFLDPSQLTQYGVEHTVGLFSPYSISRTTGWDLNALLDQYSTVVINSNEVTWAQLTDNPQLVERAKYYGLDRLSELDIFRIFAYLYLTHPTPSVGSAVQKYMAEMSPNGTHTLVGVQMRTGGDTFGEVERIPKKSAVVFAQEVAHHCLELKCSVFLTSDSPTAATLFTDKLKQLAPAIVTVQSEGQPAHIGNGATAEAHMKSYIDWIILCQMDYLVISRSGFGETASWISQAPTRQVLGMDRVIDYDNIIDHGVSLL